VVVWRGCRKSIVVNASPGVGRRAARAGRVERVFDDRPGVLRVLPKAVRTHQWVKNILLFVPLLTAHEFTNLALVARALCAFLAFCLCASGVYLLNDLLDLESDRRHAKKKDRPLAAGNLPIGAGVALVALLQAAAAALSLLLPPLFWLALAAYWGLTLAYSLYFKKKPLLDVHVLGGLYTLRVLAGNAATGIAYSPWLLSFSLFLFLSLALLKRFAELRSLAEQKLTAAKVRGYLETDMPAIPSLGMGSAFLCVLVLALYINSPQVEALYRTPVILWLLCPLIMYWVSRMWLIAYRGKMDQDPVVFALKDRVSYVVGLCAGAVLLAATLSWSL
jgi:4-hydroxybenzoate polyprenyltransferase